MYICCSRFFAACARDIWSLRVPLFVDNPANTPEVHGFHVEFLECVDTSFELQDSGWTCSEIIHLKRRICHEPKRNLR